MGYNSGSNSDLSSAYYGPDGWDWDLPHLVTYMESHDEQWLMYKNRRYGACEVSPFGGDRCNGPDTGYNTRHVPTALDRMKMAGAFFLTLPGPHMIWQFGELGYGFGPDGRDCLRPSNTDPGDCPQGTPIRTGPKPIRWEYRNDPLRVKLYYTWSEILRLRREHEVLRSTETDVRMAVTGDVKRITLVHPEMSVAILGNFAVSERMGSFLDIEPGTWYDFFADGDSISISDPAQDFTLLPGQFYLLTSEPVDPAREDLITVASEPIDVPEAAESFELFSYPNPFSWTLRVEVISPTRDRVRLELFDVLGRRVATIADEQVTAGRHEYNIDGDRLPSGNYYLRLLTREGQKTVPLTRIDGK
jgi:hypothetical protein